MPNVLKAWMLLHAHYRLLWRRCFSLFPNISCIVIFIVVSTSFLVHEIRRTFVFVRPAIVLEPRDDVVDVRRGVLVELLVVSEDDDGDIDRAEDGKLMRLLEQAAFAFEEGDGSARRVSNCSKGRWLTTWESEAEHTYSYHRESA